MYDIVLGEHTTQLIGGDVMSKPGKFMTPAEATAILVEAERRRLERSGISSASAAAMAENAIEWRYPVAPPLHSRAEVMIGQANEFPVDD